MYRERFDLSRKRIVITGANGQLGRAQTAALLEMGASRVLMVDVRDDGVDGFIEGLPEGAGKKVSFVKADLRSEAEISSFFAALDKKRVFANVLVNNAANVAPGFFDPLEDFTLETWNAVLGVNLTGMFLMTKHAIKRMLKKGEGLIINFSSIYGVNGPDMRIYDGSMYMGRRLSTPPVYATSKAGVLGFTKYVATVYGSRNIRCNAITPGGIFNGHNDTFVQRYSARVPLARMGRAEEIAGAVAFLCSDAASYVNGDNLIVDGGLSAW